MNTQNDRAALAPQLQLLATLYMAARQRSGQALLEAAGYLSQAREKAGHGEWYAFLQRTNTTHNTADRLLDIHAKATTDQAFADAVKNNHLNMSTAALLAQPSTPADVVEAVLSAEEVPSYRAVDTMIKESRANPPTSGDFEDEPQWIAGPEKAYSAGTVLPEGHATTYQPARLNSGLFSSATPEWYTPQDITDRVIKALGTIDLDPCSNSHTDPAIPAATLYTREDDGLNQPWHGMVYMNPPYGREIRPWIDRIVGAYEQEEIEAGIALLPARVDTLWFQQLRDCGAICLIKGRLKFDIAEPGVQGDSAPFPSMVVYFGDDLERFTLAFGDLGDIWCRNRDCDEALYRRRLAS